MELSYNLRYQKFNFLSKLLIDKEGETIIYEKGFRLKGKGATDKGELINFSEIKEFYYKDDKIIFVTFNKEKYILSDAGNLFDQMLIDIYRSRNEFLVDALFMKSGKLKGEFECSFERTSKFGKLINKGSGKLCLYEKNLVIIPENQDAFSIHFDFVNYHEFDEMDYKLKIAMDDGVNVIIDNLGNDYEFFQEKMDAILGGMYETLVNDGLKIAFQEFHAAVLLKLAYKMKGGKAVSLKDITKIDKDLAKRVDEFVFEDPEFREKTKVLRDMTDEYGIYYGITKDDTVKNAFIRWVLFTIPSKNIVAFSILPRWTEGAGNEKKGPYELYFYKIIIEQGIASEKVEDKVREIDQALVVLRFIKDPCYKDKRDLRHSPYQYAIRKLPFLRILRKSFVGKVSSSDSKPWDDQIKETFARSELK